jgi:hypothetical protein
LETAPGIRGLAVSAAILEPAVMRPVELNRLTNSTATQARLMNNAAALWPGVSIVLGNTQQVQIALAHHNQSHLQ